MGWDQLIRHIKNCSLPYFLPELAELALVTDMCFLLGRHRPLLLTHHPGYLASPPFSLQVLTLSTLSWPLKLTFSAGTQDKRILVVHDGEKEGGLLVENG